MKAITLTLIIMLTGCVTPEQQAYNQMVSLTKCVYKMKAIADERGYEPTRTEQEMLVQFCKDKHLPKEKPVVWNNAKPPVYTIRVE